MTLLQRRVSGLRPRQLCLHRSAKNDDKRRARAGPMSALTGDDARGPADTVSRSKTNTRRRGS
jgi:hypothetical protein